MQNLIDIACRHCEIADQMFDRWSISGRYLVFGDKADLSQLKALELYELASSMWTVRMTRTSPMSDRFTRASFFFRHRRIGTNGDTELFKKSRNINGFRACRIANNLY